MPRSGGESDKLGNLYEGIWTIGQLLDLAQGKYESLAVEPLGDVGLGIEFVVRHFDGSREFHSAKRQRSKGEWSLAALAHPDKRTGRSILSDLLRKIEASNVDRCCFVSSTGANELRELADRAGRRATFSEFCGELSSKAGDSLRQAFERSFVPNASTREAAYNLLRRVRVALSDEGTLKSHVEQNIAFLIYRPDGRPFAAEEVRVLLAGFLLDRLGNDIRQDQVWAYLKEFGYARRDWATDATIHELINERNRTYVRVVESELINGTRLPRTETATILDEVLRADGAKTTLASATAGAGKSCVIAQCITDLESRYVPVLAIRMDRHGRAGTTEAIGAEMGLPRSPAVVLAGTANGNQCVLVVDQLDAVSQASGRYPQLWEVFDSLLHEAAAYPNMRLVIACRDFDLQNDHRLRQLKQLETVRHVPIQLLSPSEVEGAIAAAGGDHVQLAARQKELLRTPLHLLLFLDGLRADPAQSTFQSGGDLFDGYWRRKEEAVSARLDGRSEWTSVIDRLCDGMSSDLTLYVRSVKLDAWSATRAAMLSEHVIVEDQQQIRFFHESFFDYAFARRIFARSESLLGLLASGEQHLFRRSQVRQVLSFSRDHSRSGYLAQLRDVLTGSSVRFHIKRVVLGWLGTLSDPTAEEWAILRGLLADKELELHVLVPIRNSLCWFDLLHGQGVIAEWLGDPDEKIANRGLWFLTFGEAQRQRSAICAGLLAPYRGHSQAWTDRLRSYFSFGSALHSRAAQELFLQLRDDGVFADDRRNHFGSWWRHLHDAGEEAPLFAIEAITHWLDQEISRASSASVLDRSERDEAAVKIILDAARREPRAFGDAVLPRALKIIELAKLPSDGDLTRDAVFGFRSNADPLSPSDALLAALVSALETLAKQSPDECEKILRELESTDLEAVAFLLLRAWTANPEWFAARCIEFLIADSRRLRIGYGSWGGGGHGEAAISREAIQACLPFVTPQRRGQLERAITALPIEESEGNAFLVLLLLDTLGEANLSEAARKALTSLRVRFPQAATEIPPRQAIRVQAVGSPIPHDRTTQFTDAEWLSSMKDYNYGRDHPKGVFDGSAFELSRELQNQAHLERRRFANLAVRMDASLRVEYFDAIIDGICGMANVSPQERTADEKEFNELETEVVLAVIRRLHRLPERPSGAAICRAFARIAHRFIPDSDLQILSFYATEDPDPVSDHWLQQVTTGREPAEHVHTYGYNSVRGLAAEAIGQILFSHQAHTDLLLPVIRHMVHDRSIAVRTCVIDALLPILNHDRDEAVRLFRELCEGAEVGFGSEPFENFIRYATSTHYAQVRDILLSALRSGPEAVVLMASRQVCLAAFGNETAEADAEGLRTGGCGLKRGMSAIANDVRNFKALKLRGFVRSILMTLRAIPRLKLNSTEVMRCGAAQVYSFNVAHATVGSACRQELPRLFADPIPSVRAEAAHCFLHLQNAKLAEFSDLIRRYIESPAFPAQHDYLVRALEQSAWQLPDITIRLAERFIQTSGAAAGDLSKAAAADAGGVSKLVVRLYAQTTDTVLQTKCLDLIDQMERFAFYDIDAALGEYDR